jgi:hypothetical protein
VTKLTHYQAREDGVRFKLTHHPHVAKFGADRRRQCAARRGVSPYHESGIRRAGLQRLAADTGARGGVGSARLGEGASQVDSMAVRARFVNSTMTTLIADRVIDRGDSIFAICAEQAEYELFAGLGFASVTVSGFDARADVHEDAHNLSAGDRSYDWVFVSDGLHHCSAPHGALVEMYRVCRRGILVFESRDSLVMSVAKRLALTSDYEIEAVTANDCQRGGVDNTAIPNHVYRWTEAEFKKTIRSFDPTGPQQFEFFYALSLPNRLTNPVIRRGAVAIAPLLKRQGNSFAMVATRPTRLWPWLEERDGVVMLKATPRDADTS